MSTSQITGVRVRFIPEATRKSGSRSMNRTLISDNIFWMEWNGKVDETSGGGKDDRPVIE